MSRSGEKLVKTHNLERLLEKAVFLKKDFLEIKENCQILNNYYTDTRYPDIWDYDRFNDEKLASQALELTQEALKFIENFLLPEMSGHDASVIFIEQ